MDSKPATATEIHIPYIRTERGPTLLKVLQFGINRFIPPGLFEWGHG